MFNVWKNFEAVSKQLYPVLFAFGVLLVFCSYQCWSCSNNDSV